jgi:hypothetical protein
MPITVVSPPISAVGPGFGFFIHTDFIGPFLTDTTWRIEIHHHGDESNAAVVITAPLWAIDNHERRIWVGQDPDGGQATFYARQVALATNDSIDLLYQLLAPDGTTVIDSGATTDVKWDTDVSNSQLLPTTGGGGLTTDQAQQLLDTDTALNPPLLATDGTPITGAVGDVIVRPALKFLGIDTTTHDLVDTGVLDVPTFAGVQVAWGLVLDVAEAPIGYGRELGYVDRFTPRAGQFLALWPAAHTAEAMVIEEYNLHLEHATWLWKFGFTAAVAYSIPPATLVHARFVSAFFP